MRVGGRANSAATAAVFAIIAGRFFNRIRIAMEVSQLKRTFKDLEERLVSLRGFL